MRYELGLVTFRYSWGFKLRGEIIIAILCNFLRTHYDAAIGFFYIVMLIRKNVFTAALKSYYRESLIASTVVLAHQTNHLYCVQITLNSCNNIFTIQPLIKAMIVS